MHEAFVRIADAEEAEHDPMWVASVEAHFDLDRFIARYFLNTLFGVPVYQRTPHPVLVHGWVGTPQFHHRLSKITRCVKRLSATWFTKLDGSEMGIIGWAPGPNLVAEPMRVDIEREKAAAEARRVEEENRPWMYALQPHFFAYLEHRPPLASDAFDLRHLVGWWIVKCPATEKQWGGVPGNMTLDIVDQPTSRFGVQAAMDFHLMHGTMLLASTTDTLDRLGEWFAGFETDFEPMPGPEGRRRKKPAPKMPRELKETSMIVRPSEEAPKLGRVYVEWMGRQVGEGDVEIDEDNRNTGCIDFDLETRAVGMGTMVYASFFGRHKPLEFWVYKVSDHPLRLPEVWSNFCPRESGFGYQGFR